MKKHLLVFLIFFITAVVITWPLIFHLTSAITDPVDGLLATWIMNWNIHIILSGPIAWFNFSNANIFFPYHNTLAFSDYHLPGSILALPFVIIFGEPVLAFNINLLLGLALTGLSFYLFVLRLTKSYPAAFLAGFVGTFSLLHLNYLSRLQYLHFWPVIFATHFLLQKKYWPFIFFFVASVTVTPLYLYFLLLITMIFTLFQRTDRIRVVKSILISLAVSSFFLIPSWQASREFNLTRSVTEVVSHSLKWTDLVSASSISKLSLIFPATQNSAPGFLGISLVTVIGIFLVKRYWYKIKEESETAVTIRSLLIVGLVSIVLSFGPFFHIHKDTIRVGPIPAIPMPYLIFYYLLPGFAGIQMASAWLILGGFALFLAAVIYLSKHISVAWVIVFCLLSFWEIKTPITLYSVPSRHEFPVEQEWLAKNSVNEPMIQFPINSRLDQPGVRLEALKMYYSTIHWRPMFNGYSSFPPAEWESRVKNLQNEFPSKDSFALLRKLKIKLVVTPRSWEGKMSEFKEIKVIKAFSETIIYQLN